MMLKKKLFPIGSIYAVINREPRGTLKIANNCLKAKVEIIQLRDKTDAGNEFYKTACMLRRLIGKKALLIINDRADIAKLCGADGLHLGQGDIPIGAARKIVGAGKIIGKSCHSLKQALSAVKQGADYIAIGPVFKTPTKPKASPVGVRLLKQVCRLVKVPVVAIGGINSSNASVIRDCGASNVAVIRAISEAKDIPEAVSRIRKAAFKQ